MRDVVLQYGAGCEVLYAIRTCKGRIMGCVGLCRKSCTWLVAGLQVNLSGIS